VLTLYEGRHGRIKSTKIDGNAGQDVFGSFEMRKRTDPFRSNSQDTTLRQPLDSPMSNAVPIHLAYMPKVHSFPLFQKKAAQRASRIIPATHLTWGKKELLKQATLTTA
jgi:hypothetical protein